MFSSLRRKIMGGYTLIEITVVLLIIMILTLVAYPNYQHAVIKSKRSEGKAALMKLMQQQERYFSSHMRYFAFASSSTAHDAFVNSELSGDPNANGFAWFSGESAVASAYELSAQACDDDIRDCVLLLATPGTNRVDQNFHDVACGILTLDSTGRKSASSSQCW